MKRGDEKLFWVPPAMWAGQPAFIVGGGPSLRGVDLRSLLDGRRTIGVNYSGLLHPWMDVLWFGDCRWFEWNVVELNKAPILKVTCCERLSRIAWLRAVRRSKEHRGVEVTPGFVRWNWNSGASAINLAYHFGCRKVVLLGIDMERDSENNTHWHDEYKRVNPGQENICYTYKRSISGFDKIAEMSPGIGLEVINANPESKLDCFRKMTLNEAMVWAEQPTIPVT